MARPWVELEGDAKLGRQFRSLDVAVARKGLGISTKSAAVPIADEWRRTASRSNKPGGTYGEGHAADTITSRLHHNRSGSARANLGPTKDFWYLSFSEFGTPKHGANPAGRRAARSMEQPAVRRFRDTMSGFIRAAVAGR